LQTEEKKFDPIAQLNQIMKNMQDMTVSNQAGAAGQFATNSVNPGMFGTNTMMQPGMMQPGMMQPGMMQPGMMPGMNPGMFMTGNMMMPGMGNQFGTGMMPMQPGGFNAGNFGTGFPQQPSAMAAPFGGPAF
jgi:hypothetical protein